MVIMMEIILLESSLSLQRRPVAKVTHLLQRSFELCVKAKKYFGSEYEAVFEYPVKIKVRF